MPFIHSSYSYRKCLFVVFYIFDSSCQNVHVPCKYSKCFFLEDFPCFWNRFKWNTNYSVNNVPLSQVDKVRDLGIIVDLSLKFDKHISLIVHKALDRSRLILKCFHSRDRVLLTKAFCAHVRPILEYCSPVWSPHFKYLITKIEQKDWKVAGTCRMNSGWTLYIWNL